MLYIVIFFILLLLWMIIFAAEIKAAVEYIRCEEEEWVKLAFYTGNGLFRYEYEIPPAKTKGDKAKFRLVKRRNREKHGGPEKNENLTLVDIFKKLHSIRIYLKEYGSLIDDIRKYLNKKKIPVELNVRLKLGTGDAGRTGLICGLIWSAAGIAPAYISKYLKIFSKKIEVTPCFDKSIFEADASCIFHVRLVHIIVVLKKIYYMKFIIKTKSKKNDWW